MTVNHTNATPSLQSRIRGCLLGGLIGDAMGAPSEGKTYQQIAETFGEVTDFEGAGTDDTAIRLILIDAIVTSRGHPRVDDFADAFLRAKSVSYRLWWVPVKNMFHKLEAGVSLPADVGWGNMHSSSSAMAIAPMGILNAADSRAMQPARWRPRSPRRLRPMQRSRRCSMRRRRSCCRRAQK